MCKLNFTFIRYDFTMNLETNKKVWGFDNVMFFVYLFKRYVFYTSFGILFIFMKPYGYRPKNKGFLLATKPWNKTDVRRSTV